MGHGGERRLTARLIEEIFFPELGNAALAARHDGAALDVGGRRLAFTTDSFVVKPLFFPGGDIGSLAVNGTVNDLAMCGARPLALSAGFILEEGLEIETLRRVAASMRAACAAAGVSIVTGDTKVVERGRGDGLYVNTAGVGLAPAAPIEPSRVRPGDALLLSGDVGRHGVAILAVREGLEFESRLESDCAPLVAPVAALIDAGLEVHCLRDLTRGGLATAVLEIAAASGLDAELDEGAIPVADEVRGACELLGLDPLYVANEGRFVAYLPAEQAPRALDVLRAQAVSAGATLLGRVGGGRRGRVTLRTSIGARRVLDLLSGEQLPRIC
jgi:hydrogenase expression/formation protein HypE